MKLSPHFDLAEFVRSEYAARNGIRNEPDAAVVDNLRALCNEVLEPLRSSIDKPIQITSGYRAPGLNAAVGGSVRSAHMEGLAADIVAPPLSITDLVRAVKTLAPYVPLNQCILEFGQWVHVSCLMPVVDDWQPSFMVASRENGKTVYRPWSDS